MKTNSSSSARTTTTTTTTSVDNETIALSALILERARRRTRFVVHNLIVYLLFRVAFELFIRSKENQIKTENTIGMEARRLETTTQTGKHKLEYKKKKIKGKNN